MLFLDPPDHTRLRALVNKAFTPQAIAALTRRIQAIVQELLEQMTGQALGVEYGVECLEVPEWPAVPRSLVRELDGRSVYTRPGVTRYATRGQLSMEQRMCQQAQRTSAPELTSEFCAAYSARCETRVARKLSAPAL